MSIVSRVELEDGVPRGPQTAEHRRRLLDELLQRLTRIVSHPALSALFDASLRIDTDRSILSNKRLHGAPHRVVHYPNGSIVLVQYESMVSSAGVTTDPISGLRYFTGLYRDMGFAEVEGRLVYLSDEVDVVTV